MKSPGDQITIKNITYDIDYAVTPDDIEEIYPNVAAMDRERGVVQTLTVKRPKGKIYSVVYIWASGAISNPISF